MSTKINEAIVNEVRAHNDIVDVIGEYVQLTRRGKNHFGLCPFHDEKTPSFSVAQDKQLFHCFGCGKGGNVFTFIEEIEQITYLEAIQFLARRIDYELPQLQTQQSSYSKETEQLFSAYDWLVKYYHHLLRFSNQGKEALDYIMNRGIKKETIERFQLGFAPHDSDLTVEFLQQKEFPLPFLVKHRLLNTSDQSRYLDPFRGRLIFPIDNHAGKTVAFGGRAIVDQEPKYLNSPEHPLFQKAQLLYNFANARGHIRKANEVILFEGYLDVIRAYQANTKHTVATLGTALSDSQAKLLKQSAETVIICFDGDGAGLKASYEAAITLQKIGTDVKIARLPDGMDPDDYIRQHGGEAFQSEIIQQSDSFYKFIMHYHKGKYNLSIDSERIAYLEEMTAFLAGIVSPIEREYYARELAEDFQLSLQVILQDIESYRNKNKGQIKDKLTGKRNTNIYVSNHEQALLPAIIKAERRLIAYMIKFPHVIERVQSELGIHFSLTEHQVIVTHLYGLYEEENRIDVTELVDKVNDAKLKNIVSQLALIDLDDEVNHEEIKDYIELIHRDFTYAEELNKLKQKQKLEKNPLLAAEIGMQIIELQKKMKTM